MPRPLVRLAAATAAAGGLLAGAPAAPAATLLPPSGKVLMGLSGGYSEHSYERETGAPVDVMGVFVIWNSLGDYVFDTAERAGTRLMIHVSTAKGQNVAGIITPGAIARGEGDAYLLRLNRRIADYGKPTYLRLLAEMNQADNAYAGFDHSGRARGKSHAPATFRQAWRRMALIIRGGPVRRINAALKRLRLRPVQGAVAGAVLPRPEVALAWVPQTRGTPDIPANMPIRYWPGGRYVDWVGTDFYSRYPNFHWLEQFYDRFRRKPFVFGEWAMWGADDPAFVRRLFAWVKRHPRVRMLMYNQGGSSGGPFRLSQHPRSRVELRRQMRAKRFR